MRIEGWESRLHAVLETARAQPYVLGEHDCFRVACAVVEALTGVNRWPAFAGYTSKREALLKIAHYGSSFEKAGDWFFGDRIDLKFARRGDIASYAAPDGEKHLGVVMGRQLYVLGELGLLPVPLQAAHVAWRVG
jgi:hypothetical protein